MPVFRIREDVVRLKRVGSMVVVRPHAESYILSPGLSEESFDTDTRLGRVNLLTSLFNAVSTINQTKKDTSDLILVLSGPVTYFYRPGGGIPWEEIHIIHVHPINLKNVGFREDWGSLRLTGPLREALAGELERSGFTLETGPSSFTVRELEGTRIKIYNPVEIGYSSTLWDILDPGTSIYIGSPENLKRVQGLIAFFPDKRTSFAGEFIYDAKRYAEEGDLKHACRPLAGAAQVLGKIRLRGEIVNRCGERVAARTYTRYLHEVETAQKTIDALWRYHRGDYGESPGLVALEPVAITIRDVEVGEFTSLCQDLGIVCIVAKTKDATTVSLDKNDLERRVAELGTDKLPHFPVFFEEVNASDLPEKKPESLVRVEHAKGKVRYYDLKKN